MYSIDGLTHGIERAKLNIQTLKDAIVAEEKTIRDYKHMITTLAEKEREKEEAEAMDSSASAVAARLNQTLIYVMQNKPADAASSLVLLIDRASVLGGSHAQRDIINDTLVAMSLRANDTSGARRDGLHRYVNRATHLNDDWFERMAAAVAV